MLAYVRLADVSQRKRQLLGRDKLLVLAAAAACRAGWADVAARCRQLVIEHNPAHLIGRFPTVAEALRSDEFETLVRRLQRLCGYERAEFLVNDLRLEPLDVPEGGDTGAGQIALSLLTNR